MGWRDRAQPIKTSWKDRAEVVQTSLDPLKKDSYDAEAVSVGIQKGTTLGARPLIAGIAGGLGAASTAKSIPEAYDLFKSNFPVARQEAKAEQETLATRSPLQSAVGELAGSFLIPGIGQAGTIKGAALTGAAMGSGKALGEANTVTDAAKDVALGGALGAASQGVLKGLGAVGRYVSKKTSKGAADAAVGATGAMLKDFRQLEGKGKTEDYGKFLLNNGLVKAGDTVDKIGIKANELKDSAGQALDSIYNHARTVHGNQPIPGFNPVRDRQAIISSVREKLGESVDGAAVETRLSKYLDDLTVKYGDINLDPRTTNNIKGALDDVINYSRNPLSKQPEMEKGFHAARQFVSKKIDESISAVGQITKNQDILKDLKQANKAYGYATQTENIAKDRVNREAANKSFGLRQSIITGGGLAGGATVGAVLGGDVEGALKGAALGAASGNILKLTEKYGPSIMANAQKVLSDKLSGSPVLRKIVEKNPVAFQNLLQQTLDSLSER